MIPKEELSPNIAQQIDHIIAIYRDQIEEDPRAGCMIVNQLVVAFSRQFLIHPIHYMQTTFDTQEIPVNFVAIPTKGDVLRHGTLITYTGVALTFDAQKQIISMPHNPRKEYPYRLHTIVNIPEEYEELLTLMNITHEENLERLKHTGIPKIRRGSDEARAMHAPNN